MQSKGSLDLSREVEQNCEVSFVNYIYLISLIIDQSLRYFLSQTNQTGR